MVYTTYFSNVRFLPSTIKPVAVSYSVPSGMSLVQFQELAPSYTLRTLYKREDISREEFAERYLQELDEDTLGALVDYLRNATDDVALVCYEKDHMECHRAILGFWLHSQFGIEVKEWERPK